MRDEEKLEAVKIMFEEVEAVLDELGVRATYTENFGDETEFEASIWNFKVVKDV